MKTKKLLGGLLLAATVIILSSCEGILDQMSTVPAFYIPEVMYNGQTYQIEKAFELFGAVSGCGHTCSSIGKMGRKPEE